MVSNQLIPMLDKYIGYCVVSVININNHIKELTCGCQGCNTSQILILVEYLKVREYLFIQVNL